MKKLITLLILFVGMVSSVSAKVIYIQDTWNFKNENLKDFCVHMWGGSTPTSWPGVYLIQGGDIKVETAIVDNETNDVQRYYKVDLGDNTSFIVNNNKDKQSNDLSASNYEDGGFYYITSDGGKPGLTKAPIYTYNFSVDKAAGITLSNIYLWTGSGGSAVKLVGDYPGASFTGGDYTYRSYSDRGTINVIFNKGNTGNPQTCDLTAVQGDNNYYISTITKDKGQAVKTNGSGYATAVSTGNLDITTGIAYVAEDKGTWAQAHTITGIYYNNPFLVAGEPNTTYCFAYGDGAALPCANAFKVGSGSAVASTDGDKYNYILNGDTFYAANDKTVAVGKAYLQLSAEATARALVFDDEETTGIAVINASQKMNGEFFNLAGQRVAQPAKGLYIVNGKKVIMK